MESNRSGGGYDTPEQESTTTKQSQASDLTLEELFSKSERTRPNSTAVIEERDLERSIDALGQLEYPDTEPANETARGLTIWTAATLSMAFVVSVGLGAVSFTTGSQLAAFISGGWLDSGRPRSASWK